MYGTPNQLVTDNGPQFISEEFRKCLLTNGIKHICTPIYHQSTNGQVERYVQIVKKGLKVNECEKGDMQNKLNRVLTLVRTKPSTSTGQTPSIFGKTDENKIGYNETQQN